MNKKWKKKKKQLKKQPKGCKVFFFFYKKGVNIDLSTAPKQNVDSISILFHCF